MNYNNCVSTFSLYTFTGSDFSSSPIFFYSVPETQRYGLPIISSYMNMNQFQHFKTGENSKINQSPITAEVQVQNVQSLSLTSGRESSSKEKKDSKKLYENSAKKNSQHNLVSQLGAFLRSRVRSEPTMIKILKRLGLPSEREDLNLVFTILGEMFREKKQKYLNLQFIKNIGQPCFFEEHFPRIVEALKQRNKVSLQQFCMFFRTACFYYLQQFSTLSILTSRKLRSVARKLHLQKQRELIRLFPE